MASLNSYTQTGCTELGDVTAKNFFLKSTELKAMTFSHLQVDRFDNENCQWLLNAALTCKDFLEVALDELWREMESFVPILKLLPGLQFENGAYVLSGNVSQADWDRMQYYSRKINVFVVTDNDYDDSLIHPSTYLRIAQLQSSALFPSLRHLIYRLEDSSKSHIFLFLSPRLDSISLRNIRGFENTIVRPFLANLSSPMLRRIVLSSGQMSVDTFKTSILHFKQLRSLELSDAVFMNDFGLWKVLGTLPYLANLTLDIDPTCHPAHDENSNSQSGDPKYFDALETLSFTGSFFLIQHFLGFIDSPYLESLSLYPVIDHLHENEPEDLLTPSMTIVASKWSQSLKKLIIASTQIQNSITHQNSKLLTLLSGLHEIQSFSLLGWRMENYSDAVKRLAMSWPKLRYLGKDPFNQNFISLSALRIIAENCPDLRRLHIQLDTSTIPPFDDISTKIVHHNLEVLIVKGLGDLGDHQSDAITETILESQIRVARHLDLIFPYLKTLRVEKVRDEGIVNLVKLCQAVRRGQ